MNQSHRWGFGGCCAGVKETSRLFWLITLQASLVLLPVSTPTSTYSAQAQVKVELCSLDIGTNCVLLYKRWSPYLKIRFHFVEQCVWTLSSLDLFVSPSQNNIICNDWHFWAGENDDLKENHTAVLPEAESCFKITSETHALIWMESGDFDGKIEGKWS